MTPDPAIDLFAGTGAAANLSELMRTCWIPYQRADQALHRLEWLIKRPETHRPLGMLLVGETNNGKTTIALRFQTLQDRKLQPEQGYGSDIERPVVYVQTPPRPDVGAFYSGILRAINAPFQETWRWERKQAQVLALFPRLKVKMLMVDEIHNILVGRPQEQNLFLNVLRYLTNELRIPLVAIGIPDALSALQHDQQLGNRLEPFELPRWEPKQAYAKFLAQVFGWFRLDGSQVIPQREFVQRFCFMAEGLTGETWRLVGQLAEAAYNEGEVKIQPRLLDQVSWQRPSDRRAARR